MVRNLSELCIQDYGLCQYTPSVMAIASMAVIEEFINGKPTELLYERHCLQSLSLSVIKECTTEIWRYLPKVMLERPMMDLSRDDFFEYLPMQTG